MDRAAKQLRKTAGSLVAECGEYATMAALFLASEADAAGEAENAVVWLRVATLIPTFSLSPLLHPYIAFSVAAGRA